MDINDISQALDIHDQIREACYEIAKRDRYAVMGGDAWLGAALNEWDIEIAVSGDSIYCWGSTFTMQTGGSHESFSFTIPLTDVLLERAKMILS